MLKKEKRKKNEYVKIWQWSFTFLIVILIERWFDFHDIFNFKIILDKYLRGKRDSKGKCDPTKVKVKQDDVVLP